MARGTGMVVAAPSPPMPVFRSQRSACEKARVAFGMTASAIAMKARCGRLRDADRADLAMAALRNVPGDRAVRAAVEGFMIHARRDPVIAGSDMINFLIHWARGMRKDQVVRLFDWQDRADLQ